MKVRVGDYARTKDGHILKITGSDIEFATEIGSDGELPFNAKVISRNTMDLIEKGDLLKIEYYSLRYEQRVERLFEVTFKEDNYIVLENAHCEFRIIDGEWLEKDKELKPIIKSIVTNEQFSQMEYRIGE